MDASRGGFGEQRLDRVLLRRGRRRGRRRLGMSRRRLGRRRTRRGVRRRSKRRRGRRVRLLGSSRSMMMGVRSRTFFETRVIHRSLPRRSPSGVAPRGDELVHDLLRPGRRERRRGWGGRQLGVERIVGELAEHGRLHALREVARSVQVRRGRRSGRRRRDAHAHAAATRLSAARGLRPCRHGAAHSADARATKCAPANFRMTF